MQNKNIQWFSNVRAFLRKYINNEAVENKLILLEILAVVRDCLEDNENQKVFEEDIVRIVIALLHKLNVYDITEENVWNEIYNKSQYSKEILSLYHLPQSIQLIDFGTHWLKHIEQVEALNDINAREKIIQDFWDYYLWFGPFCKIFTYQFLIENPGCGTFDKQKLILIQYWNYREIDSFLQTWKGKTNDNKLMLLSQLHGATAFEKEYPDRESLFLDLIKKGQTMPDALAVVNRVRKGKGLTSIMEQNLLSIGLEQESIRQIEQVRYLKSRRNVAEQFLYVQKIIDD